MTDIVIKSPVIYGNKGVLPAPEKTISVRQQAATTRGENAAFHHTGITTRAGLSIPETPVSHDAGLGKTSNRHTTPGQNHSQTGARGFLP